MELIKTEELNNIEGGLLKEFTAWGIVGVASTLIIGILNGYLRPLSCKSDK